MTQLRAFVAPDRTIQCGACRAPLGWMDDWGKRVTIAREFNRVGDIWAIPDRLPRRDQFRRPGTRYAIPADQRAAAGDLVRCPNHRCGLINELAAWFASNRASSG